MEDNSEVPLHVVLSLPIWQANSQSLRLSSMTFDVRKHSFMPNLEQIDPEHSPLWHTWVIRGKSLIKRKVLYSSFQSWLTWVLPLHSVPSGLLGGGGHLAERPLQKAFPLHSPSSLHCWWDVTGTKLQLRSQHWPWLGLHCVPENNVKMGLTIITISSGRAVTSFTRISYLVDVCILEQLGWGLYPIRWQRADNNTFLRTLRHRSRSHIPLRLRQSCFHRKHPSNLKE